MVFGKDVVLVFDVVPICLCVSQTRRFQDHFIVLNIVSLSIQKFLTGTHLEDGKFILPRVVVKAMFLFYFVVIFIFLKVMESL